MLLDIILFIVSIAIILWGANLLTDGSAGLARYFGLSPLVVGLTIVAFGTSAPELVVSLSTAIEGNPNISLGNVLGSNILNILLVGGLTAAITPLSVNKRSLKFDIPFLIFGSLLLLFLLFRHYWWGGGVEQLTRLDGLLLLFFFFLFLYQTFRYAKKTKSVDQDEYNSLGKKSPYLLIFFILLGLTALVAAGKVFAYATSNIAVALGISEGVIGLTIVALGTSLPELATSLVAALKKETDIAIGNIVGSGIFNIFLIVGITATAVPFKVDSLSRVDFLTFLASSIAILFFALFFGKRIVKRWEGAVLLLAYIIYTLYLCLTL